MTISDHERQALTVWGQHFSAQIQQFQMLDGTPVPVLALMLLKARTDGDGCKLLEPADIGKLRALLDEAAERGIV